MSLQLSPKKVDSLLPTDILFQTDYWGRVKSSLGFTPLAFDIHAARSRGDVLVLLQPFGRGKLAAYIPQGPEYAPSPDSYGPFLEELSETLIQHLAPAVAFIRYDLPWVSQYAGEMKEQRGNSYPEPRLREMRMNFGTKTWNLRKSDMDMTVASSLIVDIEASEEQILAGMKPKTRYNIGLARRKGVVVSQASQDQLPEFYDLYRQTALRNGFPLCEFRHFSALFQAQKDNPRNSEVFFFLARRHQDLLAGAIIAVSGKNALYLHGASSSANRNLMGAYALHWEAIRTARSRGCVRYDLGAVSPGMAPDHPFYGLYRFKTGFGGRIELRDGSWDYPLDEEAYLAFRNTDALARGH